MCLICVEIQSGKLTPTEGWRNLREMYDTMDEKHREEVTDLLYETFRRDYIADRMVAIAVDTDRLIKEREEQHQLDLFSASQLFDME